MLSKEKMILMTKLAIYDKEEGETDRRINEYFRHDYIFRKNMVTRFCAMFGAVILLVFYWLHKIYVVQIDLDALDYRQEFWNAAFFIVAFMIFYTLIGTIIATAEYNKAQKRLQKYFFLINKLDRLQQGEDSFMQSEEEQNGRDIVYTRNRDSLF